MVDAAASSRYSPALSTTSIHSNTVPPLNLAAAASSATTDSLENSGNRDIYQGMGRRGSQVLRRVYSDLERRKETEL